MTKLSNPGARRSVIEELEATHLAVIAADEAHLAGLSAPDAPERYEASARRLRRPAGPSLTGLANRRPDLEAAG